MRQLFLDTETTGLSAEGGDRVIELGCVELVNRKLTGNNLHFYFNPGRDSHEDALKVHGISNEFLRDKPKFKDVVQEILDYVQGAEIIIHNAAFDVGFLNKELELASQKPFTTYVDGVVDTLVMAKQMYPGKRNSLDALCRRYGIDNSKRTKHGALLDSELLAEVYLELIGGRQTALILEASVSKKAATVVAAQQIAYQRPAPLPSRLTDEERAAHSAFVADLGEHALWKLAD